MRWRLFAVLCLLVTPTLADSTFQALQPGRANLYKRLAGGNYDYGRPSGKGGNSETGTIQWLFDEADTSIIDELSAVTLIETGVNSPDYGKVITGIWSALSPCIEFNDAALNDEPLGKLSATAEMDVGVSDDFVVELVASGASGWTSGAGYVFAFNTTDAASIGSMLSFTPAAAANTAATIFLRNDSAGLVTVAIADIGVKIQDEQMRKYRMPVDRSGNFSLFVDGTEYGITSAAAFNTDGQTITAVRVAEQYNEGGGDFRGIVCELRETIGSVTANSGGPNGG